MRLASGMLVVSCDVPLAAAGSAPEPVVGSFVEGGLAFAVEGEGSVRLVASDPSALLAWGEGDEGSGTADGGASADGDDAPAGGGSEGPGGPGGGSPEGASAADPAASPAPAIALPASVAHGGASYELASIGPRALDGCGAAAARIPAGVSAIDPAALASPALERVEVDPASPHYASFDGALYGAGLSRLLSIPGGRKGAVRIPDDAGEVQASAFSHCAGAPFALLADADGATLASWDEVSSGATGQQSVALPPGTASIVLGDADASDDAAAQDDPASRNRPNDPEVASKDVPLGLLDDSEGAASSAPQDANGALPSATLGSAAVNDAGTMSFYADIDCTVDARYSSSKGEYDIEVKSVPLKAGQKYSVSNVDAWQVVDRWLPQYVQCFLPDRMFYWDIKLVKTGYTCRYFTRKWESDPYAKVPTGSLSTIVGLTLRAVLEPNTYTVTLKPNGGTGADQALTATFDAAMPTVPTRPTRDGYAFAGWWDTSAATGGTKYVNADGTSARTWNKAANATLYARWTANQYPVTLGKAGGTGGTESVTATFDQPMPQVTPPTRKGYAFQGYWDGSGATQYYDASGKGLRNWDWWGAGYLEAHWKAKSYTLGFNGNGGAGGQTGRSITVTYDAPLPDVSSTPPTRTGYAFGGWYDTRLSSGGNQYYDANGKGKRNWLLDYNGEVYARWTPISYSITYVLDGGAVTGQKTSYNIETETFTLPTPTRADCLFKGWKLTGASGAGITDGLTATVKKGTYGNLTATALWQVGVTATVYGSRDCNVQSKLSGGGEFDIEVVGGSAGPSTSYAVAGLSWWQVVERYGVSYLQCMRLGDVYWQDVFLSSEGYDCQGFYADRSLSAASKVAAGSAQRSNATLWAKLQAKSYQASFDANGGSGGPAAAMTVTYDAPMPTVSAKPTRTGYSFQGWWDTAAASGGTKYVNADGTSAQTWNKAANATLYARWTANPYTVEYWNKAGTAKLSSDNGFEYDAARNLASKPVSGVSVGYTAVGWADSANQSVRKYDFDSLQKNLATAGVKKLYLAETANAYSVSFDGNGGSGGEAGRTARATFDAAMPAISQDAPHRAGYAFKGWYDGADWRAAGVKQYYVAAGTSAQVWDKPSDATLYAGWEALSYVLAYDAAGGELAAGARGSYTIEDADFDLPSPTRYGYQFDGWDVSGVAEDGSAGPVLGTGVETVAGADGSKVTRVRAGTYGDLSCTARWTLRYDLDVPVADPGSVTFEADSMTGQVRVKPGTSADGELRSYMAVPVELDELSCEGLDASGAVDPAGGAPELEAIFGAGSASKVRFTATLGGGASALTAKVTAGGAAGSASLAGLSIPAATSKADPGRLAVAYGLELDPGLPIPPVRDAAPVARLAYTVSLAGAGA